MRDVLPDLLHKLKITAVKKALEDMEPIAVSLEAKKEKGAMTGYKEVWQSKNAAASLASEGIYEAGGSVTWTDLQAEPPLPCDHPSLHQVMALKPSFQALNMAAGTRMIWPGLVLAAVADQNLDQVGDKPKNFRLVGNKALVMAWWVPLAELFLIQLFFL